MFEWTGWTLAQSDAAGQEAGQSVNTNQQGGGAAEESQSLQNGSGGNQGNTDNNNNNSNNGLGFLFPLLLVMVVVMMVMSMTGNRREKKRRDQMLAALSKNDRVVTVGGIVGTVLEVKEDEVVLKVDEASNTRMRFKRSAIQGVVSESTE